jgi:SNF2 family DNA or RNA helicase
MQHSAVAVLQHFLLAVTSVKYIFDNVLVQYEGSPAVRQALQGPAAAADIVVASYETVRADIEWVAQRQWLYCVLDEGHIIRNPKAKVTQVPDSFLTSCCSDIP